VVFSFDVDNESPLLARGTTDPGPLTDPEFGATEGVPRIVKILDKYNIPATFFMPAVSAMLAPDMIPLILKSGKNEVALHGYIHESVTTLNNGPEEDRLLGQAIEYLNQTTGKRPVGSRTGAWMISKYTVGIEKKYGLLYDSSMMAMDVPYEIMANGQDTGLVELPVTWILDDAPYFTERGTLPYPEEIYKVYRDEFDVAYRDGTFIMLTMHPHISGRRSREIYLDQLIAYMKTKPGVWFATAEQVAKYVKANAPADPIPGVR
jgi:peptidoglycan/xylan/chitin deacetylase (PgdA/CDA1 family)